ncbi:MAG: VWA domain-containing protein [Acidobacteriota bacterium]|nr:VWA domain-containing protein [Acidobacteriota bacterium]
MSRLTNRCVALTALLFVATEGRCDDPAGPGLDLLLLVDRSGSMSSRGPAVVDALPLALNVVARSARHAGLRHRFGIVSFGSHAQTDVPLTLIDETKVERLRERIGAQEWRSLGHTNFVPPFEAAREAFRALPEDARRRRAILLITDGRASVPGVLSGRSAAKLQRIVDASPAGAVTIDVLLFGGDRAPEWEKLSRDRVHRVQSDRAEVLAALHRVVAGLTGTRSTQHDLDGASRTLILPPYLELVVFDIVHAASGALPLIPPGTATPLDAHSPGVEEVHAGDVLSTVVVRRPAAGAWKIGTFDLSTRVTVLSQEFFPRGVLIEPVMTPPVRQNDFVTIGYALRDSDGTALRELAGYPLTVDVSLSLPDGGRRVLPMKRAAGPQSLYETMKATECSVTGRYWTEVFVTTSDSAGQPVRIFEDRWSGFAVEAAERRAVPAAAPGRRVRDEVVAAATIATPFHAHLLFLLIAAATLASCVAALRRR